MDRCLLVAGVVLLSGACASGEAPSFNNDVMAVLSRAGCNQGACHGNLNGKGGFKLSLRGEDADFDFRALTRDTHGRRTSIQKPEESLILRKATGGVAHEGGPRFGTDSLEYQIMRDWIAAGCRPDRADRPTITKLDVTPTSQVLIDPIDQVQIQVKGTFSDGTTRDLSRLVVYETSAVGIVRVTADGTVIRQQPGELVILVRYLHVQVPVKLAFITARQKFTWKELPLSNQIDRLLFDQMKTLRLTPSALSSESVFVRRAYLDAIGLLPTPDEVRRFLDDTQADKRERLIEHLLQRPEFADFWAQKWSDLLRNEEKSLDRKGVRIYFQWLRDGIASGKALNELAREVIGGRGSTYQNPPANFYRSLREPYARAEAVAQVFLGTRIQCAKCHNHPFDRWTQNDYHDFAAFFDGIDYRIMENERADRLDKHEFNGEQIVLITREATMKNPRTGEVLRPRFLGGASLPKRDQDRLQALADWTADPKNPFFARAQVNRIWFHLVGRGLVDPIDDFRHSNPAVNQELVDWLAKDFQEHGFQIRHTIARIMNSRTYQLSSDDAETNHDDETHYSKALIQPLEAEQLLDAVSRVLDVPVKFNGYPQGMRSGQIAAVSQAKRGEKRIEMGEKFLKVFGKPDRLLTCECERSDDTGVMQSFQLLTGELLHSMLEDKDNLIGRLMTEKKSNDEIIETLYLAALCRYPSVKEKERLNAFVVANKNRRFALEDLAWGLVNAKEFQVRR